MDAFKGDSAYARIRDEPLQQLVASIVTIMVSHHTPELLELRGATSRCSSLMSLLRGQSSRCVHPSPERLLQSQQTTRFVHLAPRELLKAQQLPGIKGVTHTYPTNNDSDTTTPSNSAQEAGRRTRGSSSTSSSISPRTLVRELEYLRPLQSLQELRRRTVTGGATTSTTTPRFCTSKPERAGAALSSFSSSLLTRISASTLPFACSSLRPPRQKFVR